MFTARKNLFKWCLAFVTTSLVLFASACDSITVPFPVASTPTVTHTRPPEATPGLPTLVAFPTAIPPTPTSATLRAATLSARASLIAPVVQLVSPQTNAQVSVNQTIYVVAYATDDQGIARIELFVDNALVKSESAPPTSPQVFSALIPWAPMQIGASVLRVVAYDVTNRASATDEISVNVIADARKPSAAIVYPIGIPQIELGEVVPIHGIATDEAGVVQLDLWVDNQLYTYASSQNPNGQTQFAAQFAWNALTPGQHTLMLRARDTQDQTTDSALLKVFVVDHHAPVLNVAFERTNAPAGEPITVTIAALDASGIQRVELWNGKENISTIVSGNAARQTVLTTQVGWVNANPGDYALIVRAYNANGNVKESPAQIVSLLRPSQATPTPAPTATPTRTRVPRATPTARLQPPPPPSAELLAPTDNFSATQFVRATFSGKGNAELDHIELWSYFQGQPNPQLVCVIDAHATTQRSAQCDWSPPTAGVVYLFAQAVDIYRQTGRSAAISGYVGAPNNPSPTPTPPSLAAKYSATISNTTYALTLRQTGTAIRGELKIADNEGRITSGALKADRVTFHVDFAPPAAPITSTTTVTATVPTSATPFVAAIDFDCGIDLNVGTLTCASKDSRGRAGNIQFRRE